MVGDHASFSYSKDAAVPPGIFLLQKYLGVKLSFKSCQLSVLILTFLSYTCFHAARKPLSISKSILNYDDNGLNITVPTVLNHTALPSNNSTASPIGNFSTENKSALINTNVTGWPPFSGSVGKGLLGDLDVAFLACYSLGMYFSGHIADRMDLRVFLSVGMIGSGIFTIMFGMGYFWNIHFLVYYIGVQMLCGTFQSTGWPSVVAAMANWYGKENRGLVMGIWNAHTSVGNILGSLLASAVISWGWGWTFMLPGLAIALVGLTNLFFLIPHPDVLGLSPVAQFKPITDDSEQSSNSESSSSLLVSEVNVDSATLVSEPEKELALPEESQKFLPVSHGVSGEVPSESGEAIGFLEAWRIPGVASFAFCLFFAKLVAYTFLDWLPFYIAHTEIAGDYLDSALSGMLSTLFDIGGIFGGIFAGHLSDAKCGQATIAASFMALAVPSLGMYFLFGHVSLSLNVALLALCGFLINGPYALITCAVSADLGEHSSLRGNSRGMSTVTAIIDGTGSVGAAIGPFLTGIIAQLGGQQAWGGVFLMLMTSASLSVLCLVRLLRNEWQAVPATEPETKVATDTQGADAEVNGVAV